MREIKLCKFVCKICRKKIGKPWGSKDYTEFVTEGTIYCYGCVILDDIAMKYSAPLIIDITQEPKEYCVYKMEHLVGCG